MKINTNNTNVGTLILRLVVGGIFMYHGITKLNGMEGTVQFFGMLGFAPIMAYFVAWLETIGGLFVVLGWAYKFVAPLLSVIMLVAIFKVKGGSLVKAELDILLLASLISLLTSGAGKYAVPCVWPKKSPAAAQTTGTQAGNM